MNIRKKTDRSRAKLRLLGVLAVAAAAIGGGVGALMAETTPAPHAATVVHIRAADDTMSPPTTTTSTSVPKQPTEVPAPAPVVPAPVRQPVTTTTTTVRPPVTVAPVTPIKTAVSVATSATTTTAAPQVPNVPEFVDASCSGDVLTVQGQMTSAQAGVMLQLLIANDAFLVTAQTDAAGDFVWTGTGPTCAPDMNLFVGMFGALTTTTTSCEVDCFESSVVDEPQ